MEKTELDSLDQLLITHFPGEIVKKSYTSTISCLKQFPDYVGECLISDHMEEDGTLYPDAIKHIQAKIQKNTPDKRDKEILGSRLIELGNIELIDHFQVYTDLRKAKYFANVPILDKKATVDRELVMPGSYQDLLKGGLWGAASLEYVKSGEFANINMNDFESFQTGTPNLKRFIKRRINFSKDDWLNLIIRTIGLNPNLFSLREKWLYITRLIPLVEKYSNSLEFGPPSTGKSYLFENISEHVRMILGGKVTPAKFVYDQNSGHNGLIFTKDVVVFDEINKADSTIRQIVPSLQQIMASNRAERGGLDAMTDVSLHFQGNPIKKGKTDSQYFDCINKLPLEMYDCAFLDRLHRYIHGWEFSAFSEEFKNQNLGLLISYFGQICHRLRLMDVDQFISEKIEFKTVNSDGTDGIISSRDYNAVKSTLSGLIKLIYPHQILSDEEWKEISNLAIEFRQNIIDEMAKIDPTRYRKLKYELKSKTNIFDDEETDIDLPEVVISTKTEKERNINKDKETSEFGKEIQKEIQQEIPIEIESTPEKVNEEEIIFPTIYVNENNQITRQIPYWYVKYLIEFNLASLKSSNLILNPKKESKFSKIIEDNVAILIKKSDLTQSKSINYDHEEQKLPDLDKKLNFLRNKIDDFSKDLAQIQEYQKVLKNYYCIKEPSPENTLLLMDFDELARKLPKLEELNIQDLFRKIKAEKDGISEIAAKNPDLLQYNFHSIITPYDLRLTQMDKSIKKWTQYHSDYITKAKPLIKKASEMNISLQKLFDTEKEKLFEGQKFNLFAVDMNNFHVSLAKYYDKKHPGIRIDHSKCYSPLVERFLEFFKKNEPLYILFFVSKYIEGYKQRFNELNGRSEWYIEALRKYNKYMDVDSNLTSYTSIFLEKHSSQISEFYLCCGDIDVHSVIDIAHKRKIPAKLVAPFPNTLNTQYLEIVDDSFCLFD